jgi:hypothetical protein
MDDDFAAHHERLEARWRMIAEATALNAQCRALAEKTRVLLARGRALERRNADLLKRMGRQSNGKG